MKESNEKSQFRSNPSKNKQTKPSALTQNTQKIQTYAIDLRGMAIVNPQLSPETLIRVLFFKVQIWNTYEMHVTSGRPVSKLCRERAREEAKHVSIEKSK